MYHSRMLKTTIFTRFAIRNPSKPFPTREIQAFSLKAIAFSLDL